MRCQRHLGHHLRHGPRHFGPHGCGRHGGDHHGPGPHFGPGHHGHHGHHLWPGNCGSKHWDYHNWEGMFSGHGPARFGRGHSPRGPFPFECFGGPFATPFRPSPAHFSGPFAAYFGGCAGDQGHKKWHHDWTKNRARPEIWEFDDCCDGDDDDGLGKEELITIIEALATRTPPQSSPGTPHPTAPEAEAPPAASTSGATS